MKMKKFASLFLASVMCLSLVGCGGSSSDASSVGTTDSGEESGTESVAASEAESVTADKENAGDVAQGNAEVTMWTFLDPANTSNGRSVALSQMIEEFEEENPGITVKVEPQDYTTMTAKFLAATATGDAPDIIWCARDELCGVLDAGALEPLENLFLGEWSAEDIADIDDSYFRFGERDGQHYVLSLSKNAIVVYYRSDLLEAAGKEIPATWEELFDVATALTGKDETTGIDRYGLGQAFSAVGSDSPLLANYFIDKQGDLFAEDGTANWANEIGVAGIDWIANAIDSGITPAESVNTNGEDMLVEFQSGKYGMVVGGAVRVPTIRDAVSYEPKTVQIAETPGGCILDGWFVGVWSGSEHKQEAGKFLEKMYAPESEQKWVELGGQAPVRKSTLESMTIDDSNKYLQVMLDAFENGWFVSNEMTYSGWKTNLHECIQAVLGNNTDPMEALQTAEEQFNSSNNR